MKTIATKKAKKPVTRICFTALFAALIAGGTFIAIPIGPVPIVLQNLFTLLAGLVLGPLYGAAAVALYLFAGLLGAPVFAGFTGGITRFAGPTGGFLIGYLLMAVFTGLIAGRSDKELSTPRLVVAVSVGLLVVYVPGIAWLMFRFELGLYAALMAGFFWYIPGDIFKGIAAVLIARRLRKTASGFLQDS